MPSKDSVPEALCVWLMEADVPVVVPVVPVNSATWRKKYFPISDPLLETCAFAAAASVAKTIALYAEFMLINPLPGKHVEVRG